MRSKEKEEDSKGSPLGLERKWDPNRGKAGISDHGSCGGIIWIGFLLHCEGSYALVVSLRDKSIPTKNRWFNSGWRGSTDHRVVFFPLSSSISDYPSRKFDNRFIACSTINVKPTKRMRRKGKKMRVTLEILSEKPQTKEDNNQESKKPKK
ncbi:hypothetical protein PVK06_036358 [Gossypium arboreum]|uniref:Uncharacterized protein n=1 Tax=Gossypium arboreum TaxID=29729 RepID=A0ABR0NJA6_GOSAR|nr:hypothetical protein PVK06_036358 [Gossypium arboreum]